MTTTLRRPVRRPRAVVLAAFVALTMSASVSGAPAFAQRRRAPEVQKTPSVNGVLAGVEPAPQDRTAAAAARPTANKAWPAAGAAVVDVPGRGKGRGRAGGVDVAVRRAPGARPVGRVKVEVLPVDPAVAGVPLRVTRADGGTTPARVTVEVGYRSFENAIGGNWSSRLRLVSPDGTPVPSKNHFASRTVVSTVEAAPEDTSGTRLMLAAGASGGGGDFTATSLTPSAAWQVNTQTGDFSWSYPFRVPPAVNGPAPALQMSYSSGSVDGRTSSTNAQPSWIGEGHSLEVGYVERKYVPCGDDMANGALNTVKTGDLCWRTDNANVVLAGHAGELVKDATTGQWRLENDDASKIERLTGGFNGDNDTEYWKLTTTDGTQYFFGLGKRYATDTIATNAAWTVPVFGNHTGEPCKTTTWATSYCTQAWRWNLAYVVDPHGNTMTYFYTPESNSYGRNNNTAVSSYHRGGYLTRIEYGERKNSEATTLAAAQVDITVKERCVTATTSTFNCETTAMTSANASNWPDVPFDQICTSTTSCTGRTSPTFFTRKRLTQVQTKYLNGTTPTAVDTWALTHTFPDPGDGTSKSLWLASIQHTGNVATTAITLPKVSFAGLPMANRVDGTDTAPPLVKYRVGSITSETGAITSVNYSGQECVAVTNVPASPETNTKRCFPVWWTPEGGTTPLRHYFHKYVVTGVVDDDQTASSADKQATYTYLDTPAWHYDDNELSLPKYRTYADYRGYGKVKVTLGTAPETVSVTENTYFRGMDGDPLPGGGTRDVQVSATEGLPKDDHPRLAGQLRETRALVGTAEVSGAIFDQWISPATATNGTANAYLTGTERSRRRVTLSSGGFRRTETATAYDDDFGMATQVDDLGDTTTTADDLCTRMTYARNTTLNIVDSVASSETVSKSCDATTSRPADVVSASRTYFDGSLVLGAAPTRGLPTKNEILDSWPVGGSAVYKQTNRMVYDANGRVTETYDAANTRTALFAFTPATAGPVTQVTETNALGFMNTTTLHPAWGVSTAEVDANAKRTDMTYDALGRLTQVWAPGRAKATFPTSPHAKFTYLLRNNGPTVVTTEELRNDGTYTASYALYDGLLRPRQTQRHAPGGGRVLTDTVYDTRGLVEKENGPYYNASAPGTSLLVVNDASMPTQVATTYDGSNRPTVSKFNAYGVEQWRTTTTYGGDRIDVDPPDGATARTTFLDARERVIELREYHGGAPTGAYDETTYAYWPSGQQKTVTDSDGNEWSYTYDLRGRRIGADDPDKGVSTTTYDDLDRVRTVTDARPQTIAMNYDVLGRRTEIREGSATGTLRAKWVYDELRDANNVQIAKGKASSSSRFIGGAEFKTEVRAYDDAYRPTSTRVTIPTTTLTPTGLAGTYNFTATYNIDGTVKSMGQPAAPGLPPESLGITYNTLGLPETMIGYGTYVAATTYSPFGEVLQLTLGNNADQTIWHTKFYEESTRRLSRSVLDREIGTIADADVHHTYDDAGNVTKISDAPVGGTVDTQCFTYDHLRRLSEAWTSSNDCAAAPTTTTLGTDAPYWHSYTYDATGNRLSEVQHAAGGDTTRSYDYPLPGDARPHAVSSVTTTPPSPATPTTETFQYDEVGNLEERTGPAETLTWDPEGRLESVTGSGGTTTFAYDAEGDRMVRKDPLGTTLYLDNTEIRLTGTSTASTRYYDFAGSTIAVRTGVDVETLTNDHHGTATMSVDNTTGALTERRFTPFGGPRGSGVGTWTGERSFVGGTADASTRLVHLGARDYDPVHGRFISVDPIIDYADPQQMNGYAYSNNSPLTFSDPDGLLLASDGGSGGSTGGGGAKKSTSQSPPATGAGRDQASEMVRDTQRPLTVKDHAEIAVNVAQHRQRQAKKDLGDAISGLVKIASDVLGITAAVNCVTQGDAGACGEMALNIVMSVAGGVVGKILAKYGAPWKWKAGLQLAGKVWKLADKAIGALRGLFKAKDELKGALRWADEVAEQSDEVVAHADEVAGCVRNSFTASTPVSLADGTTKPISDVDIGDMLLATDPLSGLTASRPVTALISHGGMHAMVDIALSDGTTISATSGHPIWDERTRAFVPAGDLQPGALLRKAAGGVLSVTRTTAYDADLVAHNLTVAGLHTYYAGSNPVLVHNCNDAKTTLTNIMKNIHSRGSTAEAVVREAATGRATKGKFHFQKAAESAQGLNNLIESGQLTGRHLNRAIYERDQLITSLLAAGL